MREIKFRAWLDNKMLDWKELLDNKLWIFNNASGMWVFMQYTGLKDKNGKEIYEEDIVSFVYGKNTKGIVTFEGYEWKIKLNKKTWISEPWSDAIGHEGETVEVLGNIYENPELLK